MYTLIGGPKSRAFRVLWALEELELEYTLVPDPPHGSTVSKYNPTGKVPVLMVGDQPIIDSVAAVTYLTDVEGRLTHPAGTLERAQQDSFTQFLCDELDSCLWTATKHQFTLPEDKRVPAIVDSLKWEFARSIDALGTRLGDREFLAGDIFTVPDLLLRHLCGWARATGFPLEDERINAHAVRMKTRPAYRRAVALRNPPDKA